MLICAVFCRKKDIFLQNEEFLLFSRYILMEDCFLTLYSKVGVRLGKKEVNMRKVFQLAVSVCLAVILLCASSIQAYASPTDASNQNVVTVDEGISPYLTNCATATFVFAVIDGKAEFAVTYIGYEETFVMAKVWVQVQKKYLGLFWRDVGDEWIGTNEDLQGAFMDSITADGTGTYRANFTLHIVGNTGVVDVLEDTLEYKYS